ncbi:MAG: M56 family metallopeptidase [Bacteroidales bacterium]|nr:M56 family metallopeptidase [Bacteroidales bacterium]
MNDFANYHIESAIALAVIYLFYRAFLRNETFFRLNRLILLGSLPLAFIIPLIDVSLGSTAVPVNPRVFAMPAVPVPEVQVQASPEGFQLSPILVAYLVGVAVLLLHALYGFFSIFRLKRKAERHRQVGEGVYLVDKGHSFSFFRMIFLNRESHTRNDLEHIKEHEKVHVKEYHSIDALLIHMAIIFQWFNPFVWLLKYAIYENHEFTADRETSREASNYKYQDLLLKQAAGIPLSTLVHPFNKLSLKRRFTMLLKKHSKKRNLWKYLVLFPIVGALFLGISCSSDMENSIPLTNTGEDSVHKKVDVSPRYKGGSEALANYIDQNLDYPEEAKEKNISGFVYARFIVNKDGSVSGIEIVKGLGHGCDEEVEKTLENMQWQPGEKDGNKVRTMMFIPIVFKTNGEPQLMLSLGALPVLGDTVNFAPQETQAIQPQGKDYYTAVDQQPQFPGGEKARMKYMQEHIDYPQEAQEKGIEGTVYVQFIIEKDGSISNAKVLRGIGGGCDKESLEVVQGMPKWEPGKVDGEPVRTQFNMPIRFTLNDSQKQASKKDKDYHILVDDRPEFKGGEKARMEYLKQNIEYPKEAQEKGIEGTVYVQFIVEEDGSISNVKLLRGIGGGCDEEALEVVKNMPDWKPGKKDGEPVRTQFNMPIQFSLGEKTGN